jgi:hypothetical protein
MASEGGITDKQIASAEKQIASAEKKLAARKRFEAVFPLLVEEITSHLESIHLPANGIEWFKNVSPSETCLT